MSAVGKALVVMAALFVAAGIALTKADKSARSNKVHILTSADFKKAARRALVSHAAPSPVALMGVVIRPDFSQKNRAHPTQDKS